MIYIMTMWLRLCVGSECEMVAVYDSPVPTLEMCMALGKREVERLAKFHPDPICNAVKLVDDKKEQRK